MSKAITLHADGRKVRCASNRRFALAIPHFSYVRMDYTDALNPRQVVVPMDPHRLIVRQRSDAPERLVAAARRLARDEPGRPYYLFDLADGTLIGKGASRNVRTTGLWARRVLADYIAKRSMG